MKKKKIIIISLIIVLLLSILGIGFVFVKEYFLLDKNTEQNGGEQTDSTEEQEYDDPQKYPVNIPTYSPTIQEEENNDLMEELPGMTISDAVIISDVYAVEGENAVFTIFNPDTEKYEWEFYNKDVSEWQSISKLDEAETNMQKDEFYRNVSTLTLPADEENDDIEVRCIINNESEKEAATAKLHVISEVKSISAEDYKAEAGIWLNVNQIPVDVVLKDGSEMTICGLQNLYFCYEVSSSEDEKKNNNEVTTTITTVTKEEKFFRPEAGDNNISMRYRINKKILDTDITIIGTDTEKPVIESYSISDYQVTRSLEEPIDISVEIRANDNFTASEDLKYYFGLSDEEIDTKLFSRENIQSYAISHNGNYKIYVMDEAGNITEEQLEIIVIDEKAPEISSVSLAYPDMSKWFESNTITVEASDKSSLSYNYACNGVDSGYIKDNSYSISHNGTWTVSVKDEAGNIAIREIEVTNIDNQAPVIISIDTLHRKQDGTNASNTVLYDRNTIVGYDKLGNLIYASRIDNPDIIGYDIYGNPVYRIMVTEIGTAEDGKPVYGTDTSASAAATPSAITIQGAQGPAGIQGPAGSPGKDGSDGKNGKDGSDGQDGTSSFIRYSVYENGANMTVTAGPNTKYIGTYTGKTASNNPQDYTWSRYRGEDGKNGQDGKSSFIRYATSSTGNNMTVTPNSNTKYIGTYIGDSASENPADYTWTQYRDTITTYSESDNTLYIIQ